MLIEPPQATPALLDRLCDGIRSQYESAVARLPVLGLGVVQSDGPERVVLSYVDSLGATEHQLSLTGIPDAVRPGASTVRHMTVPDGTGDASRLFDARVFMVGMPQPVRDRLPVRQVVIVPVPAAPTTTMIAALSTIESPTSDHIVDLTSIADQLSAVINQTESSFDELTRLRRLDTVERVMSALMRVLDIRHIIERLSDVTREAIPHDVMTIAALSPDWSFVNTYARAGTPIPDRNGHPYPTIVVETFRYHILDNIRTQPLDPAAEGADAGMQSSLGLPITIEGKPVAIVGFSSKQRGHYGGRDLAVGRRIANYLALAMSHQRLAEESHRAAALQERETNLTMLDGLLSTLAGVLDVRDVFERVSEIAKKVLPHDLLGLPLISKDRDSLIVHAVVGAQSTTRPLPLTAMNRRLMIESWDHLIVDDILLDPSLRESALAPTGVRSLLRVAIRVEHKLMGFLDFGMFTVGYYQPSHALVARRIADHVALVLSHNRLAEESQRATALAERTANLEMLDGLLATISGVLDVREVFGRVSAIAKRVLPHDMMALPLAVYDAKAVLLYAVTGDITSPSTQTFPFPESHRALFRGTWDHFIYDDVQNDPLEHDQPPAKAGYRSLLRIAIRLEGKLVGVLDFASFKAGLYTPADALIGRRIADHVALALSHQRLAAEMERAIALQESAANLQMLDGLLGALTGVLDIRDVFTRVSEITSKVIPHDAMALPILTDDGEHVIPFATVGVPTGLLPPISPIPESVRYLLTENWDTIIVDDIQTDPKEYENIFARAGLHSMMRVAIRLDGSLVSILIVFSRKVGAFTKADALIGRRIADHVAMAISHQRLADQSKRAAALQERTANLQMLDGLLRTLTGVLDIRQVFDRVSEISQKVLPHDAVAIGEIINDGEAIRMHASQGLGAGPTPFETAISDRSLLTEPWDYRLIDDISAHPLYEHNVATVSGMHSVMFVPIRLEEGRLYGGLTFYSRTKGHFKRDDALIAKRIADHIALALSHHRLAEESRRTAALEERAANLDALDGLLNAVSGVLDVRTVFARISEIGNTVMPHDAMTIATRTDKPGVALLYAATGALSHLSVPMETPSPYGGPTGEPEDFRVVEDLNLVEQHATMPGPKVGLRSILTIPIRIGGAPVAHVNFLSRTPGRFTRDDVPMARRIADHIALTLSHEQLAEESRRTAALQERAANLDALDGLLNAVSGVLDVRTVFARISEIGNTVMPHDAMTIVVRSSTPNTVRLYAATGDLSHLAVGMEIPVVNRRLLDQPFDYELIEDVSAEAKYANTPAAREGMRSILLFPIRSGGQPIAGVNFLSRKPHGFSRDDVPMARRITDHIALALSHEQLAEEMRKGEELRSRTANIGLLDALLASVTDATDMRTVFDRVCEIAQKVLSFDAMVVPELIDGGARMKIHALRVPEGMAFPNILDVTSYLRGSDWEHDIVDDLPSDPRQNPMLVKLGFRSALRIAIRVEGQLTSGVAFYAFAPGIYKEADVAIGRRVAGRIAISLMREQGMAASKRADEASERASRLESRVQALTDELNARSGFHRVVGKSQTWRQALTQATQVASTETTVLLLGESGTGKEVVARFIHRASQRKNGPFVALNCAALPEQLLESELFGYERGAFTGAMNARAGKIEQAAGGVLFLDEVGEMSPTVQAKFLRVLQEREFQRLGGSKTLKADARVIAATNRDPKIAMEKGAFREDLYYRLSVFEISLPPLRERREDILLLVENFLSDLAKNIGRPAGGLSEDAKDRLLSYHWPGNVRELRNAIERAVILAEGGLITSDHLPMAVGLSKPAPAAIPVVTAEAESDAVLPPGLKLEALERDLLNKAMAQAKNNKSQAAKLLGVPRGQFYSLLKRHGLTDAKR